MDLFNFAKYKITKPIRVIELFAGIGSQITALKNLHDRGIIKQPVESYKICEFDKYAVMSYNAIHGTNFGTSDISKISASDLAIVDTDKYEYIMTYSFPCTDLSLAGKGMARADGLKRGGSTRSGLLWQVERLINECDELPQILLMENVPQVVKCEGFKDWINFLKSKGYVNHWKIINAVDHGIAQHRERCFMLSILSDEWIDYQFPQDRELATTVRDYLESKVDSKYYIRNEKAKKLISDLIVRGVIPENREQRTENREQRTENRDCKQNGVDLSINSSGLKTIANAIASRYDAGICTHRNERTGVIELSINEKKDRQS